uniref:Uncharacterized protein n=1 Tax=Lepeophtheirus salmonis TaxID=72036 RepID=A0A0K2TRC7_LEPSM
MPHQSIVSGFSMKSSTRIFYMNIFIPK